MLTSTGIGVPRLECRVTVQENGSNGAVAASHRHTPLTDARPWRREAPFERITTGPVNG